MGQQRDERVGNFIALRNIAIFNEKYNIKYKNNPA